MEYVWNIYTYIEISQLPLHISLHPLICAGKKAKIQPHLAELRIVTECH